LEAKFRTCEMLCTICSACRQRIFS